MDIHERRYKKCVFCKHDFVEHYSTYTLDPKVFRPLRQGCSVTYVPQDKAYVSDADVTMDTEMNACPCRGFAEIVERDEHGHPLQ